MLEAAMLALALTLQLLGAAEAPPDTPPARLLPELSLARPLAGASARAAIAAPPPGRPAAPRVQHVAAIAGSAGGDLLSFGLLAVGSSRDWGDWPAGWPRAKEPASAMGYALAVVLPPAVSVFAAHRAGAPPHRAVRAYAVGLLVHVAGLAAAGLLADASGPGALAVVAAADLVVAPWLVVRTLRSALPVLAPVAPTALASPAERARPVRAPGS